MNDASAELTQGIIQQIGEIERNDGARVVVSTPQGMRHARVALSCLVQPACGDIVLVAMRDPQVFVLAVLERTAGTSIDLNFQASVAMSVCGDLTLSAVGRTSVFGGEEVRVSAPSVGLSGESVEIAGQRVSIVGKVCYWLADTLESTARVIKQAAELWSVHARAHQRQVDDMELVRVGHMDLRAEHVVNIGSTHTIMKSRELTKIDGKQIQMG